MVHKKYPFMGKTDLEMKNVIKSGVFVLDKTISLELK